MNGWEEVVYDPSLVLVQLLAKLLDNFETRRWWHGAALRMPDARDGVGIPQFTRLPTRTERIAVCSRLKNRNSLDIAIAGVQSMNSTDSAADAAHT